MAYAKIERSGCEVRKGNVRVRLDFYLEPGDPRFNERHDTPFHSHFVYLPPDATDEDIQAQMAYHLPNFYTAFQARRDAEKGGMRHGWATETRRRPKNYSHDAARVAQCQDRVNALSELRTSTKGEGKEYPATEIDIGPGAIAWVSATGSNTLIDMANPANDTGTIDTFEVYAATTMDGTNKVGTFYGSGTDYTNRDGETIGTVEAGAKRTFTGLDIDVETGDYAGTYYSTGEIEAESGGDTDIYYKSGDQFGTGMQTYSLQSNYTISIYGTGETPVVGWQGTISGVTNPAKIMGVDVANIASVKGVA